MADPEHFEGFFHEGWVVLDLARREKADGTHHVLMRMWKTDASGREIYCLLWLHGASFLGPWTCRMKEVGNFLPDGSKESAADFAWWRSLMEKEKP